MPGCRVGRLIPSRRLHSCETSRPRKGTVLSILLELPAQLLQCFIASEAYGVQPSPINDNHRPRYGLPTLPTRTFWNRWRGVSDKLHRIVLKLPCSQEK